MFNFSPFAYGSILIHFLLEDLAALCYSADAEDLPCNSMQLTTIFKDYNINTSTCRNPFAEVSAIKSRLGESLACLCRLHPEYFSFIHQRRISNTGNTPLSALVANGLPQRCGNEQPRTEHFRKDFDKFPPLGGIWASKDSASISRKGLLFTDTVSATYRNGLNRLRPYESRPFSRLAKPENRVSFGSLHHHGAIEARACTYCQEELTSVFSLRHLHRRSHPISAVDAAN